jgi:hypothetical protein
LSVPYQAGIILVSGRRLLPLCQLLRRSPWLLPRQSGARSQWHLRLVILLVLSLRRRQQQVVLQWFGQTRPTDRPTLRPTRPAGRIVSITATGVDANGRQINDVDVYDKQ